MFEKAPLRIRNSSLGGLCKVSLRHVLTSVNTRGQYTAGSDGNASAWALTRTECILDNLEPDASEIRSKETSTDLEDQY
jgi:hypothetical protein